MGTTKFKPEWEKKVRHTGGEWRVEKLVSGFMGTIASLGTDMDGVPWIIRTDRPVPDADLPGNAALLAAAPKLLESLWTLLPAAEARFEEYGASNDPALADARAAIAAATTYPRGEES